MLISLAAALTAAFILAGCSTPQVSPLKPTGGISSTPAVETTTPPPPPTTAAPVYKPASAQGPAENVPVPVLPEKAKEFSKEGLIAFTEYWYSTLGYAFETGDPKPMMDISGTACKTCGQVGEPVNNWYAEGGWIVGGLMTVHSTTTSFETDPAGHYQVIAMVQQSPGSYYSANQTLYKAYPPTPARADIVLATFANDQWIAQTAEHLTAE